MTIGDNLSVLKEECGREFNSVLKLVNDTNINLRVLQKQANLALNLFQCKNINDLYVNTIHEAGCTYTVDAIAWMFACSIVISLCGLTMIMLRSSYYPEQYLGLSSEWITKTTTTTKSASFESGSSKSMNEAKTQETLSSPFSKSSMEIQGSQQPSEIRESATPPSTPPRLFFQFDFDAVECSPERDPQQRTSPGNANVDNDDDEIWL